VKYSPAALFYPVWLSLENYLRKIIIKLSCQGAVNIGRANFIKPITEPS